MMKKRETFEKLHDKKPVTRRDFLATGLLSFSATMTTPSLLTLLARAGTAEAQDVVCASSTAGTACPFIGIKLSGGAGLAANYVPLDAGGQLLPSYTKVGLGLAGRFNLTNEFANKAGFYSGSGVVTGIRAAANVTTLASSYFAAMPVHSQDDSAMNALDATGLVVKAGLQGKILPNLGTAGTPTGVNAVAAYISPPAPLVVSRFDDVIGSLGVSGSLAQLSANQKSSLFGLIQSMTSSQTAKLASMSGGDVLSQLMKCANISNSNLISNNGALDIDPLKNPAFSQIWGINAGTNKGSRDFVFATLVYNALNGNASSVNLEMGGFDYHNGTRATGDSQDLDAGTVMGRVLQSMAVMGKKGFVAVTSDGAVSSAESNDPGAPWMSDRGTAGMAFMMGYDPAGQHALKKTQVGAFTSGQVADETFVTGGSPQLAAAGIFLNYLAYNKNVAMFETLLPRVLSDDQKNQVIVFG